LQSLQLGTFLLYPNCNYTSIGVEYSGLLEYDVLSISKKFCTFQKITMKSSSGSMHCM